MKHLGMILGSWVCLASAMGCGDDATGSGGAGTGSGSTASASGSTSQTGTGSTTSTSTGSQMTLQAPVIDMIEALHGGLHVFWTNVTPDCDSVEAERRDGAAAMFQVVFSVPGTVDNEADDMANDPMTEYTYRLRCKKGADFSPYSNEMSATP